MSDVLVIFGTRPEAIKLAPLIAELRRNSSFTVRVCVTGQHREMLSQVLLLFGIVPDLDLDLMKPDQQIADIAAAIIDGVSAVLRRERPDLVIVQGDTTTAFAAALAAFYMRIDVAHVEAGLRSGDSSAPWPEEINRRLVSVLARHHFAPTAEARGNLLRDGADPERVHVTGNTVVDALQEAVARMTGDDEMRGRLDAEFPFLDAKRRMILVTGHRRESFGPGFESICDALATIAREHEDVDIVYPVHLNPNVREPVHRILGHTPHVHLIDPVDYLSFVHLMTRSCFVVTDSGGVQEEASTLGKPVLVMRDTTERPEGLIGGNMLLVGTESGDIVAAARLLLNDREHHDSMSTPSAAFGDGHAAERIAALLQRSFSS